MHIAFDFLVGDFVLYKVRNNSEDFETRLVGPTNDVMRNIYHCG